MSNRFLIERLGAQADGIAGSETGPVHIAFALPGETVTAFVAVVSRFGFAPFAWYRIVIGSIAFIWLIA